MKRAAAKSEKRITEGMKISTSEMHGRSSKLGLLESNVDKLSDVDRPFEAASRNRRLRASYFDRVAHCNSFRISPGGSDLC